jgi:hypothetical protein
MVQWDQLLLIITLHWCSLYLAGLIVVAGIGSIAQLFLLLVFRALAIIVIFVVVGFLFSSSSE